jgi:hypothetical protein
VGGHGGPGIAPGFYCVVSTVGCMVVAGMVVGLCSGGAGRCMVRGVGGTAQVVLKVW